MELLKKILFNFVVLAAAVNVLAEESRDPFVSLGDKIKEESATEIFKLPYSITLQGVLYREGRPAAIVNDEIVTEGQIWRDFKVEEIQKDKIVLIMRNHRVEVKIAE